MVCRPSPTPRRLRSRRRPAARTRRILLATLYGGSTATAQALANSVTGGTNGFGVDGKLATSTINQIIVNTEGQALAAFYGTSLSYWSRINLYAASGYFQGVTGALDTANGDHITTDVTVASGGVIDVTGLFTVDGGLDVVAGGGLGSTLDGRTDYGQIDVGGAADLEGALDVTLGNQFYLSAGDVFDLLQANGGLTDNVTGLYSTGRPARRSAGGSTAAVTTSCRLSRPAEASPSRSIRFPSRRPGR